MGFLGFDEQPPIALIAQILKGIEINRPTGRSRRYGKSQWLSSPKSLRSPRSPQTPDMLDWLLNVHSVLNMLYVLNVLDVLCVLNVLNVLKDASLVVFSKTICTRHGPTDQPTDGSTASLRFLKKSEKHKHLRQKNGLTNHGPTDTPSHRVASLRLKTSCFPDTSSEGYKCTDMYVFFPSSLSSTKEIQQCY